MAHLGKFKEIRFTIFPQEIRGILLLAFCLLLLLFLSLGLFALQQAREVNRRTNLIVENYRKGSQVLSQLGNLAFDLDVIAKEQMRAPDIRTKAQWGERLGQTKVEIDSYIANHLETSVDDVERQAWGELQKGVADYWNVLQGMIRLIRQGESRGGEAFPLSDSRILSSQRRLRAEREKLFLLYEKAAMKHQQEISSAFDEFGTHTIWLISLTLLLGIGIMFFSLREIQRKTNQIKEERDFSQTLIEAIGDGVVLFNLQEKIEFANRRFAEMLRYDPKEILGITYPELFHPEDLPEVKRHSEALVDVRPHTFESRLIRSDQSIFPALITVAPRLGAKGETLGGVAVLRDITERKEAERSIQRLARALEETDEIVIITDLEEKITYANKAAGRIYGYSDEELIGRHVSLLRTPDDHLFLGPEIRAASLSQGWQGEIMNRRRNGEVFPILLSTSLVRDEKGDPCAIVGISRDISERKRIQQEILQRNRELASLNAITATMSQSLNLQQTLEEAVIEVMEAIEADGCEIYIQEDGSGRPVQAVSLGMEREYSQQGTLPEIEPPWAKPMALGNQPIIINDLQRDGMYSSLSSQGFLAFASIPIQSKGTLLGVLNVAKKKGGGFSSSEVELLMASGNQMGMFVENVRSFERERRRVEELSSLIEVVQAVNSSLDLQKVLESIISMAAKLMNAPAANLMLLDEANRELRWSATLGLPPEWIARVGNLKVGESISGLVVSTGAPLSIPEIGQDPRFLYPELAERFGLHSFLGVPLIFREKPIGGLYVLTTEPRHFSEREIRLLSAMANQAALAIENARLFQETEKLARENFRRYQEVSILNELGTAMRSYHELDRLVSIILTGVTFGGGLGFNRAILFLADERNQLLEGVSGMGPSSAEEASRIWADLEEKKCSLLEVVQDLSTDSIARSDFNLLATSLKIPLKPEAGIVARTALEKRSFNIRDAGAAVGEIHREFEGRLGARAFATAPVMAREKVIGVILVDNLYNGRPISDDDLRFLEALANQAGMAVESAQLYSRLEEMNRQLMDSHRQIVQMERLALLGEMSATVAHQIRNPLVAIGGFARRLSYMDPEKELQKEYLDIIQREVRRLEQTIRDILSASKEIQPQLTATDLNQLIGDCLILYQDRIKGQKIRVQTLLERDLPRIPLDSTQMRDALSNLLDNALEAMPKGGDLHISTHLSPDSIHIEIADTGPGISAEAFGTIFDPFFTTKVNGTGLGLTLTHRIISNHGGKIEVRNLPERGAAFSIALPLESKVLPPLNQEDREEVI